MSSTDEELREAARTFWGPLQPGTHRVGNAEISVGSQKSIRTIRFDGDLVAGYWDTYDIKLLQLAVPGVARDRPVSHYRRGPLVRMIHWILVEAEEHPIDSPKGMPDTILDMVATEYDEKTGQAWLIGESYDDRIEIKGEWEVDPFGIGRDGLHAKWMDGTSTWLELSAEPVAEYERVFRSLRTVEPQEVPEIHTTETELAAVQRRIDKIEAAIQAQRTKTGDFKSPAIQIARAIEKEKKYERLLKRRDELMWRGNPGKTPEYKIAIDKFYLMQEYKGSVRQAYGRSAGLNYEVVDRTEEVTLKVHRNMIASIWIHPKTQNRILSIDAWFMSHTPLGRRIGDAILRIGEAHGYDIFKPLRLRLESRKQTDTYIGKWGKKETSTWDRTVVVLAHDDGRYTIVTSDLPGPHAIESDGWMNPLRYTSIDLNEEPETEYKRLLWSEKPLEEPEVEEIPMATSDLEATQALIDAIELEIRVLRSDEKDFSSSDITVAERLGKREQYEQLLKQRDEAMWRENPRWRDDNFDTILKLESYHGEQSTIDVNSQDGDFTFLLVQVRNGVVLNDEMTYGYRTEDAAFKDCHVPDFPCYFSEGGVSGRVRPDHRNFDLVVRLDSTHDEDTSVEIETAFGATVFAIYTVTDGWVDNWQTDYGYLAEGPAIQAAGSDDKTLRVYHSIQEGAITPEAGPAVEVSESELDAVQRGIDKIEKMMDARRKKDNDYKTPTLQVAKAVGKREKYEKLLKRRDELMWRGNPATPFTATWSSEPSHGSPGPPIKIPTEWWDEDGRVIEAKHEEEFVDLLIDKFWRRDILNDEVVETNGAFWGEHNTEGGYEWAGWRGEYRLGIIQYGDSASGPAAALRLSLRINAIDIASRIVTIERIDDKLVPIDRLFLRQSHEAVAKGGQYFASKADEMPLAIAIDKEHFVLRKLILRGAKMYPILEWVEVSTMTQNGVDPEMKLVAVHPAGERISRLEPIDIPSSNFYYDDMIEKGYGLYINLEGPPSTPSATPALDHLGYGARMNKELDRIFSSEIQVDVEELPIEQTAIAGIQERVDIIERDIRILRAKERDFDSSNSEVAARLGKQEEYDRLMRERDEAMWRGNPEKRRVVTKEDMRKRAKLPKLLYHGTSIQNMHKVLREGLLVHQPQSAYTVESEHQEDTNLNVSLANTIQDAVFFSLGAAGWGADQAIIEFDTTNMTEEQYPAILRRPLFGKTGRFEYKVYTMRGIPPEHISRVLIRSFGKPAGHLEVTEKWYTREEALSLPEPNA